jgi:hypothetical protein
MAGQRATKRNRQSRNTRRGRRRVVGLGASAGAFVAFGLTPLTTAPTAHADEFDAILDPILTTLISSTDHSWAALDASWAALDPSAAVDPSAGLDVSSVTHPVSAAVTAATPPQEDISTNAAAATPTCPAGTVCEISENGTVVVNTCLIGGVQECTAISDQGETATAVGDGSYAEADGGTGDTALAENGGEADAYFGSDSNATAVGDLSFASATGGTGDAALAENGGEADADGSYDNATANGLGSVAETEGTNVSSSPNTAEATGAYTLAYAGFNYFHGGIGGTDDTAIASHGGLANAYGGTGDLAGAAGTGDVLHPTTALATGTNDTAFARGEDSTANVSLSGTDMNDTAFASGTNDNATAGDGSNDLARASGSNADAVAKDGNGDTASATGNAANLTLGTSTEAQAGGTPGTAGSSDTAWVNGTASEAEISGSNDTAAAKGTDAEALISKSSNDTAAASGTWAEAEDVGNGQSATAGTQESVTNDGGVITVCPLTATGGSAGPCT